MYTVKYGSSLQLKMDCYHGTYCQLWLCSFTMILAVGLIMNQG